MSGIIDGDTKIIDETEKADETTQNQTEEQPKAKVITDIGDIEPLNEIDFRRKVLLDLFAKPENSPEKIWLADEVQDLYASLGIMPEKDSDNITVDLYSEIGVKIYQDYLDAVCYNLKTDSFSLDADKVNGALENIYDLASMKFATELSTSKMDKVMLARLENIPQMKDAYTVAAIGRDMYVMVNNNAEKTSQIEVENKVQILEDLHSVEAIDNEQMALAYHNIAIAMERLSHAKTEGSGINKERLAAYDYMSKALRLTANPQLIKTCYEYLPNNMNRKMLYVREACDRALLTNSEDKAALYKIHTIYSKTLEAEAQKPYFANMPKESYLEALYHYQEAFNNAETKDGQAKALRRIASLQKNVDQNASFATRAELAENYLSGKAKIRELLRLASDVDKPEMKLVLYERAANELIDCAELKAGEKSLLLSNVIHNLRPLYGNDQTKRGNLDKLEEKYCAKPKAKTFSIKRVSSKGHDYFS